jgi:NADH dehydrogenase FAD-containing subunit
LSRRDRATSISATRNGKARRPADIRRNILLSFELAENTNDLEERRRLLNFVIVGGGPTGVELAGAVAELARKALACDFRHIDPRQARSALIESGPCLLATFPERLSRAAQRALRRLGVDVCVGKRVTQCDGDGVIVAGERIAARPILWAAGVGASPAAKWLRAQADRAGRVVVGPDLTLPGHPEIFVTGDTAAAVDADGKPLPGLGTVASATRTPAIFTCHPTDSAQPRQANRSALAASIDGEKPAEGLRSLSAPLILVERRPQSPAPTVQQHPRIGR